MDISSGGMSHLHSDLDCVGVFPDEIYDLASEDSSLSLEVLPQKRKKQKDFVLQVPSDKEFHVAWEESRIVHDVVNIARRLHEKRLNSRLTANKIKRVTIYGDSSCFV